MDFDVASRPLRRRLLATCAVALAALWLPLRAIAADRNTSAFDAKAMSDALRSIGAADAIESDQVVIKAPDIAENSAIVHIEVESKLPGTQSIWVFAEKNPQPLVAQFDLLPGIDPFVAVRIKMAESAFVRAVVKADGKFWFAQKETKVTLGGCAG
ncbi:MAG: thiosulfate oxidation carrier protein SoxY [Burkholderiales bacterium]|jgi:sulfur-oxidizing protein SoxY|nr:thiosulfate oxidation carrier protein SoxY [Burkholderiales bacterium]